MQSQSLVQEKTLLQSIEHIGIIAAEFKGDAERINQQEPDILAVADFLGISSMQAVVFSVMFILSFKNRSVDIADISGFMETSHMKVLPMMEDIEVLERKHLICKFNGSVRMNELRRMSIFEIGYFITRNILNAILKRDKSLLERKKHFTMISLLEEIATLVEDRDDGNITFDELVTETTTMLQNNHDLEFVRKVTSFKFQAENLILLLYVCREILTGSESCDLVRTCEKIYEDVDTRFQMKYDLVIGRHELVSQEMLKLREGYFKTDREIMLTEKAIDQLFGKDKEIIRAKDRSRKELLSCKTLKETRLYFNREEQEKLDFVTRTLQQANLHQAIRRMEEFNMPSGVAILFHGAPGTGKTASVYDIARKTGRDIFMVDISNTKSMWFGESEKTIKELFERYRRIVDNSEKAPILLFNECDAVFSTRKKIGSSSVDQTENAIQNIILQEIETLKGILIATTNLTENLDKAFERRFLFKIAFSKPGPEVLQKILMDKIPEMKAAEARQLSERFDLSGGNIENVARKVQMHQILNGEYPGFDRLFGFCDEEQLVRTTLKNIGFRSVKEK
jgi:hypothetical protein